MNLLTAEQLTKAYGERKIFDEADFSIQEGEKIGIIGVNGTGKSTLLKILAGQEECDDGQITMGNNLKIAYLPQTPVFEQGDTVLEAALKGNVSASADDRWTREAEAKAMLNELDLTDFDQPVEQLSGGQRKRAALVRVLMSEGDILILDEPTNHLDHEMSQWLENYLLKFRGAIVLVTHDRYFLDRVVTRIVEIDHGKFYSYPGSYSRFVELKAERQNMEIATERKRQSILRTELQWLMRGARARSTKQKAHIQRIEQMQEIQAPDVAEQKVEMSSVASRLGRKTIEAEHISKSYDGKVLFDDFSYIFLKGDRIGIVGRNGCGKSTLLKVLTGNLPPDSGSVDFGSTVKIAYFSQENEALDERLKAIEYVREGAEYIRTKDGVITASAMLERFLFDGEKQWTQISRLSGGEKRRLYLLRLLMEAPNVLILDEPTNDLDIRTLTVLEDYLDEFEGIVITVSHDRYFLDRVVRRIFAFEGGGQVRQYEGGYSDYDAVRTREGRNPEDSDSVDGKNSRTGAVDGIDQAETGNSEAASKRPPREKKLKLSYKEEREAAVIDDEIAALEEKIQDLEEQISSNASNFVKLNELMAQKAQAEEALEQKMDRWVYLNDLMEQIARERAEKKG
ncbi:ABC-F family ATP-binding cassette domain-containing protein [Oscillospiraceae bacterium Marseille-Q3528]|nr:ABC-F family ATP-binding cassette domain-containing protein [Oscillospiraceae bacterium Marseille-Q3528]